MLIKKLTVLTFLFFVMVLQAEKGYFYTTDNYYNEKPKTQLFLRQGIGFFNGYVGNNDKIPLQDYSLNFFHLLANVTPNPTFIKGIFMNGDLSFRIKTTSAKVLGIYTADFSLGLQMKGFHVKYLGDFEYYVGPTFGIGQYDYVANIKNENWYFNNPPIFGMLYGGVAGIELFFSKLLSTFVQVQFLNGTFENLGPDEVYMGQSNNSDIWGYDFNTRRKKINFFEMNFGLRVYFGQNLGYTPFFFGLFEKQ